MKCECSELRLEVALGGREGIGGWRDGIRRGTAGR